MHFSRIFRRFGWALGGRVLAAVVYALSFVLLARWSDVAEFGYFSAFLAPVVLVQSFIDLGFSSYMVRLRAVEPNHGDVANCIRFNNLSCLAFMFSCFLGIAAWYLSGHFTTYFAVCGACIVVWAAFEKMADVFLNIHQADEDNRYVSRALVLRRSAAFLMFVLLYFAEVDAILAFSVALALSSLASFSLEKYVSIKLLRGLSEDNSGFYGLFRKAKPYWLTSIFTQLRNFDVTLLALLGGGVQAGFFAVANRVVSPLSMIHTSMAAVLMPTVSKGGVSKRNCYRAAAMTMGISAIPLVFVIILSPVMIPLLLGANYEPAVRVLQIVCGGLIFLGGSSMFVILLQSKGYAHVGAWIAAACSLTYLASVPLIADFGAEFVAEFVAVALAASFFARFLASLYIFNVKG